MAVGDADAMVPVSRPTDQRPVVICGFGELGQTVANMLQSPLAESLERGQVPYVAFDLQVERLKNARAAGFNVVYGNGGAAVRDSPIRQAQCQYEESRRSYCTAYFSQPVLEGAVVQYTEVPLETTD